MAPEVVKGRAIGALWMAGFGALWMIVGIKFLQRLNWRSVLLVVVIGASLVAAAIAQIQRANTLLAYRTPARNTDTTQSSSTVKAAQRTGARDARELTLRFEMIFGAELLAIAVVVIVFNLLRRPSFILGAVAIIVGVHFLPLARLFAAPLFYFTGLLMVLLVLFALAMRQVANRQAVIGIGSGVILWLTALRLLT